MYLRLIYADWLLDHGSPEWAEFIQMSVAGYDSPLGDKLRREVETGLPPRMEFWHWNAGMPVVACRLTASKMPEPAPNYWYRGQLCCKSPTELSEVLQHPFMDYVHDLLIGFTFSVAYAEALAASLNPSRVTDVTLARIREADRKAVSEIIAPLWAAGTNVWRSKMPCRD